MLTNEAPIANPDTASTDEGASISIDVLANDTDPDAGDDPTTFSLDAVDSVTVIGLTGVSSLLPEAVSISGDELLFLPGDAFQQLTTGISADVEVSYTMSDDEGATSQSILTLTVTGTNDAPVAQDVSINADEDGAPVTDSFVGSDDDHLVGHLVFATSFLTNVSTDTQFPPTVPNFGGITNASYVVTHAAVEADAAGADYLNVPNWDSNELIYTAVLSDQTMNAIDNVNFQGPVYNTNGERLADDSTEFFSGVLQHPIGYDENGSLIAADQDIWTGTDTGGVAESETCGNWDLSAGVTTQTGKTDSTDWLSGGSTNCDGSARLLGASPLMDLSPLAASILTYTLVSQPSEGIATNLGDGAFSFDPDDDFQDLNAGETRQVTFQYTISDEQGSVSSPATVTVTVTGEDETEPDPPVYDFVANTFEVTETNADLSSTEVTLSRTGSNLVAESVDVAFADGTAASGTDFVAGPATVSFAEGETTQAVPITILGDQVVEGNESLSLSLTNFTGPGAVGTSNPTATLTIQNDDTATLTVSDVSLAEGDPASPPGATQFAFDVTLVGEVQDGFTIDLDTTDGTATISDDDYVANAAALSFQGSTGEVQPFTVDVNADSNHELDESFNVVLDVISNTSIDPADITLVDGTGTIINDDLPPNSPPTANPDAETITEDNRLRINVLSNDTDPDSGDDSSTFTLDGIDAVTVSGLSIDPTLPPYVITISSNEIQFTPRRTFDELNYGETAVVTVDYTMSDDEGATSQSTLTLTVAGVNDFADKIGVNRSSFFFQDVNQNGQWDNFDVVEQFGLINDIPIIGDWNGDGVDEIGVKRGNLFYRDMNANGRWDAGTDMVSRFGLTEDLPIIGDWNGDGTDDIGVKRDQFFLRDMDGDGTWSSADTSVSFGLQNDLPIIGDWNGDGTDDIGVKRQHFFYRDVNGSNAWDAGDVVTGFGLVGDTAIIGDWNGDGIDEIGVKRNQLFYRDINGNGSWDSGTDVVSSFGTVGDTAIIGKWRPANDPATLEVLQPPNNRVFQRNEDNEGSISISGNIINASADVVQVRVLPNNSSTTGDWVNVSLADGRFDDEIIVGAGSYDVEIRALAGDDEIGFERVSNVGVGEVFLTAGQSNAANHGSVRLSPTSQRVVAMSLEGTWHPAHDPQPNATGGSGSPWPAFGDLLVDQLDVPVGIVSLGWGGTTIADWLPGAPGPAPQNLFDRIDTVFDLLGQNGARAVLWQHGESDVLSMTPEEDYIQDLSILISASRIVAGYNVPWGIAESTIVNNGTTQGRDAISAAQRAVSVMAMNFAGPNTDLLGTEFRIDGTHFNESGLLEVAEGWANAVFPLLPPS